MRRWAWLGILMASVCVAQAEAAADRCRDVLVFAAHNINESYRSESMSSDIKSALCNTDDYSDQSKKAQGGGLLVFGYFGLNGKNANEQLHQMHKQYCTNSESAFSDSTLENVLSNLVDPQSVAAWKECKNREGKGLVGSIERDGPIATLHLTWVAAFHQHSAKLQYLQMNGITCPDSWKPGMAIDDVELVNQCRADPGDQINVTIQTDMGGISLRSPAKIDPPRSAATSDDADYRQKCLSGDLTSCRKGAGLIRAACGVPTTLGGRMCIGSAQCMDDVAAALEHKDQFCKADKSGQGCTESIEMLTQRVDICNGQMPDLRPNAIGPGHSAK